MVFPLPVCLDIDRPQCETPKSPPGDYNPLPSLDLIATGVPACETPKSPPGDYNAAFAASSAAFAALCETPKSPPGDYNIPAFSISHQNFSSGVKHLNPRQGITTQAADALGVNLNDFSV